jgi:polygalacturonase
MSLTKVSYSMIDGAVFNAIDFGASSSAAASVNTAAIQAAIDAAA